jgi:hypothetical protein
MKMTLLIFKQDHAPYGGDHFNDHTSYMSNKGGQHGKMRNVTRARGRSGLRTRPKLKQDNEVSRENELLLERELNQESDERCKEKLYESIFHRTFQKVHIYSYSTSSEGGDRSVVIEHIWRC